MSARKFAIACTVNGTGVVLYWTGAKRMPWTTMQSGAKTWASEGAAGGWLVRVSLGPSMGQLRLEEVAA